MGCSVQIFNRGYFVIILTIQNLQVIQSNRRRFLNVSTLNKLVNLTAGILFEDKVSETIYLVFLFCTFLLQIEIGLR